jgi:hypothetical protein
MKKSAFDLYDMTFSYDGTAISNPTLSSCGRFLVNPITEYGFSVIHTGGGCTALQLKVEGGWVVLTDTGCSHELGEVLSPMLMGFYDGSEDENTETMWGNELGHTYLQVGVNVMQEDEIDNLAEDALNAMCKTVQDYLGIKHGDNAGLYFSDGRFKHLIKDYIKDEIVCKRASQTLKEVT